MKQKTVFLYCFGIDDVLSGSSNVAGIQVQMSFWAKTFLKHGWKVYSLSKSRSGIIDGVEFIHKTPTWLDRHGMSIIEEFFETRKFIRETKANVVFVRCGRRDLYAMARACRKERSKLVFFGASDRDFEPGKELMIGPKIKVKLYRKALLKISYIVTQNQFQADNLLRHYGKRSVIIPNIWAVTDAEEHQQKQYAAVWVANLRRLKRAEWFIHLAQQLPQYRFAIAGGVNEQDYHDAMRAESEAMDNLDFLGPLALSEVNDLIAKSRLLVCSSEFEGFPNTFLQAWAHNVPVVSTVNPSGCITEFGLGRIVEDEARLLHAVQELLDSDELYAQCQQNIKNYFTAHHDADGAYQKVMTEKEE